MPGDTKSLLQRQLAAARARESAAREEIRILEKAIADLQAAAGALRELQAVEKEAGLTTSSETATLNAMNASPESNAQRSKSALKTRHPWPRAFTERHQTLTEAAELVAEEVGRKIPKTTAQGWYNRSRPIPADCRDAIKKIWGVGGPWLRVSGE